MNSSFFTTRFKWKTLIGLCILSIGLLYLQAQAENLVAGFLKRKIPPYIHYSYESLDANIYSGKISLKNIHIDIFNRNNEGKYAHLKLNELKIDGFSYWKLWILNTIHVKSLQLDSPVFLLYPDLKQASNDNARSGVVDLNRKISLGKFDLLNGNFYVVKNKEDSLLLSIRNINFSLTDAYTDKDIIQKRIPLTHKTHELSTDSIFIRLDPYKKISVQHVELKNKSIQLHELALLTKYSPKELSPLFNKERDRYALTIPLIELNEVDYGFKSDTFSLSVANTTIKKADLKVRLDKRKVPQPKIHDLYSKIIRELPIYLNLDSVSIISSRILYEEKRENTPEAGYIVFDSINARVNKLSNTYPKGEKTQIHASSHFMRDCLVTLNWSFDVNDLNDNFLISGTAKNFNAASINQFLTSNEKAKVQGTVDEFYFTASGNKYSSSGQVQMKYKNFTLEFLKDDYQKVKKVVTTISNLIVSSGKKNDEDGYRHGEIAVERNPEKPFFNFLWVNIRNGLKSTMTGNGKKEN